MFGFLNKKTVPEEPAPQFPPVPEWRPSIVQPIDKIAARLKHYTSGTHDFAFFTHGTIAVLPDGLTESQAEDHAKDALSKVFHAHPDMQPLPMNDGNILIRYNHEIVNLVLHEVAEQYWAEIKSEHQRALARDEVLITPLGQNKFDDFGMKALFGRCFMFMDAQAPAVVRIERRTA